MIVVRAHHTRQHFGTIFERNIARCTEIIEDLLDYTRVREPTFGSLALDDWLSALVGEQTLPSSVDLTVDLRSGATVLADPERLRQAVVNLLDNACEIMKSGDESAAGGRVALSSSARDDWAEIRVTDTGPGIPAAVRDRIFEPLFSTRSFGFGLGLPRVRQIMEQHGGGVEVESASSAGTTMRLWLPLREARR